MTDDARNELAREIAGDILRAQGDALTVGRRLDASEMVRVIRDTLRWCEQRAALISNRTAHTDALRANDV